MKAEEAIEAAQDTVEEINIFMQQIENHISSLIGFGFRVVLAILIFIVGRILIKWVRKIVRKTFERSGADAGVSQFVDSLLKFGLYALLIFTIATKFGVDTASVAAVIASAGVAVGLALQGSLSNFAGGILILLLKPFVVGDYIIEDNNHNEGTVKEIQLFYTKLTTIDNRTIIIPNAMLTNNSLTNVTEKEERRLDLKIDISYDADLKKAKEVIRGLLEREERIKKEEEILIFVDSLGESSIVLGIRAWVKADDYWSVRWGLLEEMKLAMDEAKIKIPYPQMEVHMKKDEN